RKLVFTGSMNLALEIVGASAWQEITCGLVDLLRLGQRMAESELRGEEVQEIDRSVITAEKEGEIAEYLHPPESCRINPYAHQPHAIDLLPLSCRYEF